MKPLRQHRGLVAPLHRINIDTDQIIPKQFLKRIERTGYGEFLFYDWRLRPDGSPEPSFVLNEARYRGASILVGGRNFGCGSSREHAPWALSDYGFQVVIAPSFADIFLNNCAKNGLLTVTLSEEQVTELARRAHEKSGYELTVDLEKQTVSDNEGFAARFEIDPFKRHCLLHGLDDIALTLEHEAHITEFEKRRIAF
jgi:3-isopropylmalate/(R)-2-methylmalate dehydratase small subunit